MDRGSSSPNGDDESPEREAHGRGGISHKEMKTLQIYNVRKASFLVKKEERK